MNITSKILVATALLLSISPATAETYSYVCKDGGKSYSLKVTVDVLSGEHLSSDSKLEWRGVRYRISDANAAIQAYDPEKHPESEKVPDAVCGKGGWHAAGNGKAFDFCYATKGYADFDWDGRHITCNQKR